MMKNYFCFTLKAFFVLRYLSFYLDFLVMYKNNLIRKIKAILKFMTSQPGQQTIAIHILPNISRRKRNQTMKFGQLIEYNIKNIFLERSYTKCGWKTIPRLFPKNWKLSISLNQWPIVLYSFFIVCQVKGYQSILKLSWRPLGFTSYKTFLKNIRTSLIFCIIFKEKYLSRYILLAHQVSLPGCLYFLRYWLICFL